MTLDKTSSLVSRIFFALSFLLLAMATLERARTDSATRSCRRASGQAVCWNTRLSC